MRDERPTVAERCREFRAGARELLATVLAMNPAELGSRWWAGDAEANPALRAVAKRLDDCLTRFDALQIALDLPEDQEPRYHRLREVLDGANPPSRPECRAGKGAKRDGSLNQDLRRVHSAGGSLDQTGWDRSITTQCAKF